MTIKVHLQILPHGNKEAIPCYQTKGSAGIDLPAALDAPVVLNPGTWQLIPTGLSIAIPQGYEGQIRSRSGLSFKHGIIVLNAPGTIDSDYRGEVKVVLMNMGSTPFTVEPNMRIAQLVFATYATATWDLKDDVSADTSTDRGQGGFGSTGTL